MEALLSGSIGISSEIEEEYYCTTVSKVGGVIT